MQIVRHPLLLNDIMFKIVFGSPQSESVLRALLNALLARQGRSRIVSLELLNPNVQKEYLMERGVVLDVKARDGEGRLYNIEVQVSEDAEYINRSLYYLARLYAEQLERGEEYRALSPTIAISLLDYALFPDIADLHTTYRFYDRQHQHELSDILEIHYVELPKFKQDKPTELRTPFERWLYVLKFGEFYDPEQALPEPLQSEEGIAMAIDKMRAARASDEVRELIEARLKFEHDEASRLGRARREGQQEGLQQGLQQGLKEGARHTAAALARKLLQEGMSRQKVLELTGLKPEDLS